MISLGYLGAEKNHTKHFAQFNHLPERKPWAGKLEPSEVTREMVSRVMGKEFPLESIDGAILDALEGFAALGVEGGIQAYFDAIGKEGRTVLKALKRNFERHPERWRDL